MRTYQNFTDGRIGCLNCKYFLVVDLKTETSPIESKLKQSASLGKIEILYFPISRTTMPGRELGFTKNITLKMRQYFLIFSLSKKPYQNMMYQYTDGAANHNFKIEFRICKQD